MDIYLLVNVLSGLHRVLMIRYSLFNQNKIEYIDKRNIEY